MPDALKVLRQGASPGRDEDGSLLPPETTATEGKCRLRGLTGGESIIAGQLQATATATVVCPLSTDVLSSDSLEVNGVAYDIRHVLPRTQEHSAHRVILVSSIGL